MKLTTSLLAAGLASQALAYAVGGKPKDLIKPYKRDALQDIVRSASFRERKNKLADFQGIGYLGRALVVCQWRAHHLP